MLPVVLLARRMCILFGRGNAQGMAQAGSHPCEKKERAKPRSTNMTMLVYTGWIHIQKTLVTIRPIIRTTKLANNALERVELNSATLVHHHHSHNQS